MRTAARAAAAESLGEESGGSIRSFCVSAYTHGKLWRQDREVVKTFVAKFGFFYKKESKSPKKTNQPTFCPSPSETVEYPREEFDHETSHPVFHRRVRRWYLGLTKKELLKQMNGHILAEVKLTGTYERK
ncbi:MAG: hypothetical protein JXA11_16105 [Phycisphaerae bacterium]|nr:hypothetical protein [Phycisphaerae bacterium]